MGRPAPRRRPPWWPEDQAWPPSRGRRRGPPPFVWRFGCLAAVVVALAVAAGTLAAWLVAGTIGIVTPPRAARLLPLAVLLLVAIAAAGAGRGMRRMIWPLGELVRAAGRIEAGDYSASVPEHGPPELRSVARAFNAIAARLRADEERRRSFLADVTHELRTPLSVIRGQAEAIADGVYPGDARHVAPIIDAARTLELLTEDLRTLALAEAGSLVLHREPVDVAALVDDSAAAFRAQAEAAGVALTAPGAAPASGAGQDGLLAELDPARMRSVLGNLLSNALRHTPRGGSVRLSVRSSGDRIEVTVTDTGEGIPPDLLPHVFERFVKTAGSGGSGLGLAIAHDVVTAHGGEIAAESRPGDGTTVRLTLPAASPPS